MNVPQLDITEGLHYGDTIVKRVPFQMKKDHIKPQDGTMKDYLFNFGFVICFQQTTLENIWGYPMWGKSKKQALPLLKKG